MTTRSARRYLGALALLPLFVLALPFVASAADTKDPGDDPDNNKSGDLALVTTSLPAMAAGQEGWVSLIWSAETDVCDVEVTAKGKDIDVSYPTNTGKFSSLYTNNALAETNLDYTAFKLRAPEKPGTQTLTFEAKFTRLEDSAVLKKSDDLVVKNVTDCKGKSAKVKVRIDVAVNQSSGPAVELQSSSVEVSSGSPTWVSLSFRGNQPGLDDFRVKVDGAAGGFAVVYPQDGSSSGLSNDSRLPVAASDTAAVQLDPLKSAAGTYKLPVSATWKGGSWSGTLTVRVK